MRLLTIAFPLIAVSIGFGQKKHETVLTPEQITMLAENEMKDGGTFKLRGHVQVITASTTIYADEADYNPLTAEVDARGHVRIHFKNAKLTITIQNSTPEDLPTKSPK